MFATKNLTFEDLSSADESALISATLCGNHQAFAELVSRNQSRLYAAMYRVARSADMADELVQDTFVQAYLKLNTFKHQAAFFTWLFRIGFNKYMSLSSARHKTTSIENLTLDGNWQPVDPVGSGENEFMRAETRQEVIRALAALDANSRRILELREMDGLSYEEIGAALQIEPGTVRSRLARSRRKLLRQLEAHGWKTH